MRGHWVGMVAAACMGLGTSAAFGQSLLEQLEKKVRDGLELTAPKGNSKPGDPSEANPADEEQLPAPKPTPPPPPSPSAIPANRSSSSILEPPAATQDSATAQPADGFPTGSKIYLGLEAESLTGGGIGARVVGVTENSPAWRAGFQVGDVILAIDGHAIANLDSMVERLAPHRPGDSIKTLVVRGARNIELTAVLQSAAVAQRIQNGGAASLELPPFSGPAWLGLEVADLSTAFRNQFGLRVYRAAAITDVVKGSPAASVNIVPGDAIVAADGRKIESARDLSAWLASKRPGDRVSLTVMRGTRTTAFDLTLAADPNLAPAPPQKPIVSDPFQPPGGTSDLALGEYADTAVGRTIIENTVPPPASSEIPAGSDITELEQLRAELRAAREQIDAFEQRLRELENRLTPAPD